jgi:uncharacterized protein involved in outer membrane biogenesis
MPQFLQSNTFQHKKTQWTAIVLGLVMLIMVLVLAFFDWNALRPTLARIITAKTGRPASIDGDLKVHLFSFTPRAEINDLKLENPPWADRKIMFEAKRITVSLSLGRLLRGQLVLPLIDLDAPTINLERDAKGRASWELGTAQGKPTPGNKPAKLPTIQRLVIEHGQLHVVDQIRKLTFNGSLVAADEAGLKDTAAFKIRSSGTLNAKPFRLDADGGPLLDLAPDKPYSFSTHLTASDIDLDTQVTVPKPFDLSLLDFKFTVTGNDLADVFYLTGLALPNTPKYRLSAAVHLEGTRYTADDFKGRLGSSDIGGRIQVDTGGARPKLTAKLSSHTLNIVDLAPSLGEMAPSSKSLAAHDLASTSGAGITASAASKQAPPAPPTAARAPASPTAASASSPNAPPSDAPPTTNDGRLLPDANLQVNRVRGMDADVTYTAGSVTAPKLPMNEVNFHLVLNDGVLSLDPLSFVLDAGKFTGKVQIDARSDVPVTDIDMRLDKVDLGQFKSATMKKSLVSGTLFGRFHFHGPGTSVHKFAAASNGAVSVVIPHGEINDAVAELTGINVLKGLGLLLSKDPGQTDIRCGIMDFKDHQGSLNTTTVYVDTTNVLITGRGKIDLGPETIDLALQGDPKKIRLLRLRSPISLHGTFLHPAVGIEVGKLAEQVGIAAAIGAVLTPAAAALAFIDPGLAKDKDCASLMAQAAAGVKN